MQHGIVPKYHKEPSWPVLYYVAQSNFHWTWYNSSGGSSFNFTFKQYGNIYKYDADCSDSYLDDNDNVNDDDDGKGPAEQHMLHWAACRLKSKIRNLAISRESIFWEEAWWWKQEERSRPCSLAVLSTGKPSPAYSLGQNFLDLNLSIVGQSKWSLIYGFQRGLRRPSDYWTRSWHALPCTVPALRCRDELCAWAEEREK